MCQHKRILVSQLHRRRHRHADETGRGGGNETVGQAHGGEEGNRDRQHIRARETKPPSRSDASRHVVRHTDCETGGEAHGRTGGALRHRRDCGTADKRFAYALRLTSDDRTHAAAWQAHNGPCRLYLRPDKGGTHAAVVHLPPRRPQPIL